tara:strand:+ start:67 stop:474 length:408 start_codon:yes stop_codon:yes gene_type:complete
MKNLILTLLILCSTHIYAQDLKLKMPTPTEDCKTFNWKNGEDVYVEVEFKYLISEENKLSDDAFRTSLIQTLTNAKYRCKNKLSFVPKRVTMMYSKDRSKYNVVIKFWASNSYGVKDELTAYYTIDKEGNVIDEF